MARDAVNLIQNLMGARAAGLFARDDRGQTLVYGECLCQAALDRVATLWPAPPPVLSSGLPFGATDPGSEASFVVLPCLANGDLRGLMYVEAPAALTLRTARVHALAELLGDVLRVGGRRNAEDARDDDATTADLDAFQLTARLEKAEWNVSQAARLMGTTRMTLYNRMKRLGVKRLKPPKRGHGRRAGRP